MTTKVITTIIAMLLASTVNARPPLVQTVRTGDFMFRLFADGSIDQFERIGNVWSRFDEISDGTSKTLVVSLDASGGPLEVIRAFEDGRTELLTRSGVYDTFDVAVIDPGEVDPFVAEWIALSGGRALRVWSDGSTDILRRQDPDKCEPFDVVESLTGPIDLPAAISDASLAGETLLLSFGDGSVHILDITSGQVCPVTEGGGAYPFCQGDTDRDGIIDFDDLLRVLDEWGVCEN